MENKDEGRLQAVLQTLSQYGTSTLTLDELRAQKDGVSDRALVVLILRLPLMFALSLFAVYH